MTYDNPKLILVRWHDACADIGWNDYDEDHIKEKSIVVSVGWLIAKNGHSILLAADNDAYSCEDSLESTYNRTMQIPIVCIDSVCVLHISHSARDKLDNMYPETNTANPEISVVDTPSVEPAIRALPQKETFVGDAKKKTNDGAPPIMPGPQGDIIVDGAKEPDDEMLPQEELDDEMLPQEELDDEMLPQEELDDEMLPQEELDDKAPDLGGQFFDRLDSAGSRGHGKWRR